MRVQKLAVIFTLVAFSLGMVFAEDVSPKRKSSEEFFRQNSGEPIRVAKNSAEDDLLTEALRQKQLELDAAENAARTSPVSPTPAKVEKQLGIKPKKQTKEAKPVIVESKPPVKEVREVIPKVVVVQPSESQASDEALSEALRKKQSELDAKESTVQRSAPAVKVEKPIKVKKPVEVAAPVQPKKTPAMERAEAKEREATEKRIRKIEAEIKAKEEAIQKKLAKASSAATAAEAKAEGNRESRKKAEAMTAAVQVKSDSKTATATVKSKKQVQQAPPVQVSGKEARLAELLRKYKADQITPHEYHLERAKIISEP